MGAHQAQRELNTLTSGISMLKIKWNLKMLLWNIVRPSTCGQIFYQTPTRQSVQTATVSDHGF